MRPNGAEILKRLDLRAPLVVDTRELGRRPGSMRTSSRTVPAPADLGNDVLGVRPGSDLTLDLRLEAVMEGVLVTATVAAEVSGECVRCLDPLERPLETEFQELYAYEDIENEDEEQLRLVGDLLDLEQVLRDAVVLALPLGPLCRDDCPGLCADCGARLAEDPGHRHEVADTRWAALTALQGSTSTTGTTALPIHSEQES